MTTRRLRSEFTQEAGQTPPGPKPKRRKDNPDFPEDKFYREVEDRTIFVKDISATSAHDIVAQLRFFDKLDPDKPITMIINSGGGYISAGMGIIGVMKSLRAPVHTVAFGDCESMASLLLAAGTRGHRQVYAGTRVMIHQNWQDGGGGTESEMASSAQDMTNTRQRFEHLYLHFMNLPATKRNLHLIADALETDTVMNAAQVKALGLADEILAVPPDSAFDHMDDERRADLKERRAFMKIMAEIDALEAGAIDMTSRKHSGLGQRAIRALITEREKPSGPSAPDRRPANKP